MFIIRSSYESYEFGKGILKFVIISGDWYIICGFGGMVGWLIIIFCIIIVISNFS